MIKNRGIATAYFQENAQKLRLMMQLENYIENYIRCQFDLVFCHGCMYWYIFQIFILFSRAGKKKDSFFLFCLVSCFCFFPCTTKLNLVEISLTLVGEDNFHTEDKTITNKEKFEDGRTFSNSTLHCYTSRGM